MGRIWRNRGAKVPWLRISRYKRQEDVCRLRTKIGRCPWFSHAFFSHAYVAFDSRLPLGEDGRHPLPSASWCDIYMPSPVRRDIFYNVTIITLTDQYLEQVWDDAYDATMKYLADTGQEYRTWDSGPFGLLDRKYFEMHDNGDELDFGGMTMHDFAEARRTEILNGNSLEFHEKWELDTSYRYGVGLTIYANVKNLDTPAIISVMGNFFERYEGQFLQEGIKTFEDKGSVLDKNDLGSFAPSVPLA